MIFSKKILQHSKQGQLDANERLIYSESLRRLTTSECYVLLILLSQPLKKLSFRVKDVAPNWISWQLKKDGYFPVQVGKVRVGRWEALCIKPFFSY